MAAPLLLVLGRPLTLVLRTLPPGRTRRVCWPSTHSRPAAWLLFPPLAALLDIGGLWLLHRTPLLAATHHRPLLGTAVHLHVLAAGLLFTFAVCRLDPVRRRWSLAWRGTTLLAAGWAHAVLAKTLYAAPPPGTGFAADDVHTAARLMYQRRRPRRDRPRHRARRPVVRRRGPRAAPPRARECRTARCRGPGRAPADEREAD